MVTCGQMPKINEFANLELRKCVFLTQCKRNVESGVVHIFVNLVTQTILLAKSEIPEKHKH